VARLQQSWRISNHAWARTTPAPAKAIEALLGYR
jgi:hypothetical protein